MGKERGDTRIFGKGMGGEQMEEDCEIQIGKWNAGRKILGRWKKENVL